MKNEFTLTATFSAKAETIYKTWLTTQGHTLMTGSPAKVDGTVNGNFTAWDGYIWGSFLELEENKKITQTWRTSEFPEEAEDSQVEILLVEANGETGLPLQGLRDTPRKTRGYPSTSSGHRSTTIILKHTNIPEGQAEDYKTGWEDFYFKPMKEYFG